MTKSNFVMMVQVRDVKFAARYACLCGVPIAVTQLWLRTM